MYSDLGACTSAVRVVILILAILGMVVADDVRFFFVISQRLLVNYHSLPSRFLLLKNFGLNN